MIVLGNGGRVEIARLFKAEMGRARDLGHEMVGAVRHHTTAVACCARCHAELVIGYPIKGADRRLQVIVRVDAACPVPAAG